MRKFDTKDEILDALEEYLRTPRRKRRKTTAPADDVVVTDEVAVVLQFPPPLLLEVPEQMRGDGLVLALTNHFHKLQTEIAKLNANVTDLAETAVTRLIDDDGSDGDPPHLNHSVAPSSIQSQSAGGGLTEYS
jgi:hypothetical protein